MAATDAQNELDALKKLATLTKFALDRSVRIEEIRRQLSNANQMVPERTGSDADARFVTHESVLRKFLDGGATREAVTGELQKTQDLLGLQGR